MRIIKSLTRKAEDNPTASGILMILVILAGGYYIYSYMSYEEPPVNKPVFAAYYMDMGDYKLYQVDSSRVENFPPIKAPSGDVAVKAYLFGCGACDPEKLYVGYLETYSQELRNMMVEQRKPDGKEDHEIIEQGELIAPDPKQLTDPSKFVWLTRKDGGHLAAKATDGTRCSNGEDVIACYPTPDIPYLGEGADEVKAKTER